ncbi:MAG: hypothetical protein QM503_14110 [Bacteroidota bacterium]
MKTINYLLLIVLTSVLSSYTSVAQEINPLLYEYTWQDNETRTFNGYDITKIFGQLPNDAATYNYSPITAVSYKSLEVLEDNFTKIAKVEKWTTEVLDENIKNIQKVAGGGQIQFYLTRYTEDQANMRWYFIIIRGIDDKGKIFEYNIPYKAPQNPVNNGWWNYTTIDIPVELPDKFYIYLNNKVSGYLSDFKFLVEKNK